MRALKAWPQFEPRRAAQAVRRGFSYLAKQQHADGYWIPLWFGDQDHPEEENPVYGTAKVLLAYQDWERQEEARRGTEWLCRAQRTDGGWGGAAGGVEQTALALETLAGAEGQLAEEACRKGLERLLEWVESDRYLEAAPIGFYFAKLWYYEKNYPLVFTAGALGRLLQKTAG